MTFKEYFSRDILVEITLKGPHAGDEPHSIGPSHFNAALRAARIGYPRGKKFNPDETNMPKEWDVVAQPGKPWPRLPHKQIFIADDTMGVEVTFKGTHKSDRGRTKGVWNMTKIWNWAASQHWD